MRTIYLLQDDDPEGGYYCAQTWKPDMRHERPSISEVREVVMPAELWDFLLGGGMPLDEDGSNDSTWRGFWREGETVWSRPR